MKQMFSYLSFPLIVASELFYNLCMPHELQKDADDYYHAQDNLAQLWGSRER